MPKTTKKLKEKYFWLVFILVLSNLIWISDSRRKKTRKKSSRVYTTRNLLTTRICLGLENTLRARHKSCFLRPDTGPCRADIIQWYYDVKQKRCYRFFWGGCQGNGNRFESEQDCRKYCYLQRNEFQWITPNFCSLTFDYGNCFGYFNRWAWNPIQKACKRHLYSGCGGNQNNFESLHECLNTCLMAPNNTLTNIDRFTTCVPIEVPDIL